MKKKLLAFILVFASILTFGVFSVNALESNRDAFNSYFVEGGDVTNLDELIKAFSDENGVPHVKVEGKSSRVVLDGNIIVKNPIIIKEGFYQISGAGCTIFRGSHFNDLIVLDGAYEKADSPYLILEGPLTVDGMNDKYNADSGLIHILGKADFEAENVTFVNSTSSGKAGGAICIRTYETEDEEQMPLGANVTLKRCTFESCFAPYGGAIAAEMQGSKADGYYLIEDCTFNKNATYFDVPSGMGGAIYSTSGSVAIANCTFTENKSEHGGAIFIYGDTQISGGKFEYNTAEADGGAIYIDGRNAVSGCIIQNNVAKGSGGAIYAQNELKLEESIIMDNVSEANGGGIYITGTLEFISGNIMNNEASYLGGGVYLNATNSLLDMTDGEIAGNKSQYCGSVYCEGDLMLSGAIGNGVSEFPQIYISGDVELKKTALVKNDTLAMQVTELDDGEEYYPFVRIASGFAQTDTLKLAYVKLDEDGEFDNVTVGGVCAVVADEKTLEYLVELVEFEGRGLLSYVLIENGETVTRMLYLPIWAWIIIFGAIAIALIIIFRKKIVALYKLIKKKCRKSKPQSNQNKKKRKK